ncbi:MAG TPA: nucleoside triphosphate pyrophosphatase [Dongiaceae bacterium]|nr:nucleoside triphosphate pyrophosphatase [Dongiaceae bacterium]
MLYLASTSPRRRELLTQIGVPFQVLAVDVNEDWLPGESAQAYVQRLAADKAMAGWRLLQQQGREGAVLGADTTGLLDDRILVKPTGRDDAVRMLLTMSGRTHEVLTGVALASGEGGSDVQVACSRTAVRFRPISAEEAAAYWDTGEPADKAGAYGIQGFGALFVENIAGSYTGVVGLPLFETAQLLRQAGIPVWQRPQPME